MTKLGFASIPELLAELKAGHAVLLADGTGREAVADLVCAAERVTPRLIGFFAREGHGMTGLALPAEKCDALGLAPRPEEYEAGAGHETVTFDARKYVRTGLSATDRATSILTAIADDAKPGDLKKPGHVHALRAAPGGVLARAGLAEAAVDMAKLAGLRPAAVVCPVMTRKGELANLPKWQGLAVKQRLKMGTVPDLVAHWIRNEVLVRRVASTLTQNEHGAFRLIS
jgi:3,4-dihydroxy 2-butanone 4-phosphate synthase/GTP cyclohydrolase II